MKNIKDRIIGAGEWIVVITLSVLVFWILNAVLFKITHDVEVPKTTKPAQLIMVSK